MGALVYSIFVGLTLLLPASDAEELRARAGSNVTFHLPLFKTCPNLRLSDPRDATVLTVANSSARFGDHVTERSVLAMGNGDVLYTLMNVDYADEGTYFLEVTDGVRIQECEKMFALQLERNSNELAYWMSWGPWSGCADVTTCGRGLRKRSRDCTVLGHCYHGDGQECEEVVTECVFYAWNGWTTWSGCSATCGSGYRRRQRNCWESTQEGSSLDQCVGDAFKDDRCTNTPCAVPAAWTSWSPWTRCSTTCGRGIRQRNRMCQDSTSGGSTSSQCVGEADEADDCYLRNCEEPVVQSNELTFSWTAWSHWSTCSRSCDTGWYTRDRMCYDQYDRQASGYCQGDDRQNSTCSDVACKDLMSTATPSGEPVVAVPLWTIIGVATGAIIVLLLVVIIALVVVLRRKSRTTINENNDTTQKIKTKTEAKRAKLKLKPKQNNRESKISAAHVYAEINDDDVISYVKSEKSMSIVTTDNPYSPYPNSSSPSSDDGQQTSPFLFYVNSGQKETAFTYVNSRAPESAPPTEIPNVSGNTRRHDSAGYLAPIQVPGQNKQKTRVYKKTSKT